MYEYAILFEKKSTFKNYFVFPGLFPNVFLMINVQEDQRNNKSIETGLIFILAGRHSGNACQY